jgi:hypothetical protein
VDRDNVGVREPGGRAGPAQELLADCETCGELGWEHLQRDGAVEAYILREMDNPHG